MQDWHACLASISHACGMASSTHVAHALGVVWCQGHRGCTTCRPGCAPFGPGPSTSQACMLPAVQDLPSQWLLGFQCHSTHQCATMCVWLVPTYSTKIHPQVALSTPNPLHNPCQPTPQWCKVSWHPTPQWWEVHSKVLGLGGTPCITPGTQPLGHCCWGSSAWGGGSNLGLHCCMLPRGQGAQGGFRV